MDIYIYIYWSLIAVLSSHSVYISRILIFTFCVLYLNWPQVTLNMKIASAVNEELAN